MHPATSGISVIEIPARGQVIPVSRESVTAFIGPAPRGPVNIPVAVRSLEEFLARFGVPGYLSRMEFLLYQYFENGGTLAVVVRVCRTGHRNRLSLPGAGGATLLDAANPGPLEYLRASVDYEGVAPGDPGRFNLVVHRCRSPAQPLVEEQEVYRGLSLDPADAAYAGDVLAGSRLVRLAAPVPAGRPDETLGGSAAQPVRYVYSRAHSQGDDAPTDYDLIGSRDEGTGLFALEQAPWLDFVCLVPGLPGTALGPVALFAAERYCRERHAILVLDPPESWRSVGDVVGAQRQRGFASPNAVTYFPALESPPQVAPVGVLSAAGAIAGRLGAAGLAPAGGQHLALGRTRPAVSLDPAEVHQLSRLGVNSLTRAAPSRVELEGLVTMARSGGVALSWNSLRHRRVALFILSSLERHTRWAAFEQRGVPLWEEVRAQATRFLAALHAAGLLAGATDREAFYVKCDADTHGGSRAGEARVVLVIGLALVRAGEFIAFEITQGADRCTVAEIGWQPGLALAS